MSSPAPERRVIEAKNIRDLTDPTGSIRDGDRVRLTIEGNATEILTERRNGTVELVYRIEVDRVRGVEIVSRL